MKGQWLKLSARYDALQLRERWLVALCVLGVLFLIGYSVFIGPAVTRSRQAERSLTEQGAQISAVQAQLLVLQSPEQNPDVAAGAELARARKQLGELSGRLAAMENSLVPPQRMSALLEELIGRKTGLRLLSLKTLPVTPLLDKKSGVEDATTAKPADPLANSSAGLFKHGVVIRLEGSYQELAAYLERLEQSKSKLLWSSVVLSVEKHPKLVLTLTVFTLSLDRAWLIV